MRLMRLREIEMYRLELLILKIKYLICNLGKENSIDISNELLKIPQMPKKVVAIGASRFDNLQSKIVTSREILLEYIREFIKFSPKQKLLTL